MSLAPCLQVMLRERTAHNYTWNVPGSLPSDPQLCRSYGGKVQPTIIPGVSLAPCYADHAEGKYSPQLYMECPWLPAYRSTALRIMLRESTAHNCTWNVPGSLQIMLRESTAHSYTGNVPGSLLCRSCLITPGMSLAPCSADHAEGKYSPLLYLECCWFPADPQLCRSC